MKIELKTFRVTPSVVPADCESEICIHSLGGWMLFYDDITYEVQFIPADESDIPADDEMTLRGLEKNRKTYHRLTKEDHAEIYRLHIEEGYTKKELSKMYNRTDKMIAKIFKEQENLHNI